jgi:hypothetical protein
MCYLEAAPLLIFNDYSFSPVARLLHLLSFFPFILQTFAGRCAVVLSALTFDTSNWTSFRQASDTLQASLSPDS